MEQTCKRARVASSFTKPQTDLLSNTQPGCEGSTVSHVMPEDKFHTIALRTNPSHQNPAERWALDPKCVYTHFGYHAVQLCEPEKLDSRQSAANNHLRTGADKGNPTV